MDDDDRLVLFSVLVVLLAQRLGGTRVHVSTLHRWRTRGIGGRRLEATRLGGRWFSSISSVNKMSAHEAGTVPATSEPLRRSSKAQSVLVEQHGF